MLAKRPSFGELFRYLAARGEFVSADLEAELSRSLEDTSREVRYERTRPDGRIKIGDPAARAQGAAAFICTALIASGILIIVLSHGFFMNLLGAGTAACGGAAAYLTLAERRSA